MLSVWSVVIVGGGCSQNPYLAGGPLGGTGGGSWTTPRVAEVAPSEARIAELSRRVQLLDDNNRQLHTQLAQSEQRMQVFQDEADLLRRQLADVSGQLQNTQLAARESESRVRGMRASAALTPPPPPTIRANTNATVPRAQLNPNGFGRDAADSRSPGPNPLPRSPLPSSTTSPGGFPQAQWNVPAFQTENDPDGFRVIVPSDQLFPPNSTQMYPQAAAALDPVISQIKSRFPQSRIGVESYTDASGDPAVAHQLTASQASAVLDLMTRRGGLPANQLFTVAQGANNPRHTNHTASGRSANRRIELMIYR